MDKLESIPGFQTGLEKDRFIEIVNNLGISLIAQTASLAPADKGIYSLRNHTATIDSIPLIAITGQNVRAQLGKEAFQAVDIAEIVKPVTKISYCVKESEQLPWIFREAFRIAREGRPGPVLIDLPLDVQRGEIEYDPASDSPLEFTKPVPHTMKELRERHLPAPDEHQRLPVFPLGL